MKDTRDTSRQYLHLGKTKAEHLREAVGAVIASTTGYGRYRIAKEGFPKFDKWARTEFRNLANLPFISEERFAIWRGIVDYYNTRDSWDRPYHRRRYASDVRANVTPYGPDSERPSVPFADIETTSTVH